MKLGQVIVSDCQRERVLFLVRKDQGLIGAIDRLIRVAADPKGEGRKPPAANSWIVSRIFVREGMMFDGVIYGDPLIRMKLGSGIVPMKKRVVQNT